MSKNNFSFPAFLAGIVLTSIFAVVILLVQKSQNSPQTAAGKIIPNQSTNEKSNPNSTEPNKILEVYETLTPQAKALYFQQSKELTQEVAPRLVELDLRTIGCFGPNKIADMSAADQNLGGQCCGALKNVESYNIQLEALSDFINAQGGIDFIPHDPYDVPVAQAQSLTAYDESTVLTPAQQSIYDEAIKNSHHGGPCCCKCWKWYMMSGLAKKLIVEHNWTSEQIAQLWDLSSSCGHEDDTNMVQHYQKH